MEKTKPTVTVLVIAYNEEKNIIRLLNSILVQKETNYKLEKVVVISDGSTDKTVSLVQSLNSAKIDLKSYKVRIGKSSRLNQIYLNFTSEILVQADADVVFSHKFVIADLVKPLTKNKEVGLCGGNPEPYPAHTFIENAVNATVQSYLPLRLVLRGGNNIFSADGRLLALKKELARKITIPPDMIANDAFVYFSCLNLGFKYRHVPKAVVNFRSPQTLKDQINQNTRFVAGPIRMMKYFPKTLVEREYSVPFYLSMKYKINQFILNPFGCITIYLINTYCRLKARLIENRLNSKWDIAVTTKKLI